MNKPWQMIKGIASFCFYIGLAVGILWAFFWALDDPSLRDIAYLETENGVRVYVNARYEASYGLAKELYSQIENGSQVKLRIGFIHPLAYLLAKETDLMLPGQKYLIEAIGNGEVLISVDRREGD